MADQIDAPYTAEEVEAARAAHAEKDPETLAYEAGRAAERDAAARAAGVDACPFSEGTERAAWLRGFAEALEEQPDIRALRASVREAHDNA